MKTVWSCEWIRESSRKWKGKEISHVEFLVTAICGSAAARRMRGGRLWYSSRISVGRVWHSSRMSVGRVWYGSGNCSEGNNGKKAEQAREHVWQQDEFLEG